MKRRRTTTRQLLKASSQKAKRLHEYLKDKRVGEYAYKDDYDYDFESHLKW